MRRLATVVALISPTTASGQYTFRDWPRGQGFAEGISLQVAIDYEARDYAWERYDED
jgi:hypothetical protein